MLVVTFLLRIAPIDVVWVTFKPYLLNWPVEYLHAQIAEVMGSSPTPLLLDRGSLGFVSFLEHKYALKSHGGL